MTGSEFKFDSERIKELRGGQNRTMEVSPAELREPSVLTFSDRIEDLAECDVFIVTLLTPINSHKQSDLTRACPESAEFGSAVSNRIFERWQETR